MSLTLEQVKAAGLPATVEAVGIHGGEFTVDYLPGNPTKERFRVSGGPYKGVTWGPGGVLTPQDGWHHAGGCECAACGVRL